MGMLVKVKGLCRLALKNQKDQLEISTTWQRTHLLECRHFPAKPRRFLPDETGGWDVAGAAVPLGALSDPVEADEMPAHPPAASLREEPAAGAVAAALAPAAHTMIPSPPWSRREE